jgi:hypothetical protein
LSNSELRKVWKNIDCLSKKDHLWQLLQITDFCLNYKTCILKELSIFRKKTFLILTYKQFYEKCNILGMRWPVINSNEGYGKQLELFAAKYFLCEMLTCVWRYLQNVTNLSFPLKETQLYFLFSRPCIFPFYIRLCHIILNLETGMHAMHETSAWNIKLPYTEFIGFVKFGNIPAFTEEFIHKKTFSDTDVKPLL